MAITPFKDRFGKIASCSTEGVGVSLPSLGGKITAKITGSTTASRMPQSLQLRQGVSIRTTNQFMQTFIRPVIYAGDISYTDKYTDPNAIHEFRVNDYGDVELFDGIGPFKDYGKLNPKDLINDPDVPDYPQVFFNPSINSPGLMDGVLEPLTIRDSMLYGLESPFSARRIRAEFMDGNINPDPAYGTTRITQFFPVTASAQIDPYIDSVETRMAVTSGSTIYRMVVPGIISDIKRLDTPFDDARPTPWKMTVTHTASTSERGLVDYLKKSAGAGFTYMNNPEGTDSIIYGGDFRSGSLGSPNSFELNSGFISFTPPRIVLRDRDNATGSYPTVGRTTGRTLTLGNYKTHFNDDNTIIFSSDVNVVYPSVIQSGATRFLPDYTSSLEATATVKKGVSDQLFDLPVSGVNITPFDETRLNLQTSSFYMTGTKRSVLPGFEGPLKSKTQIVLDVYSSENCDVYVATSSNSTWEYSEQRVGPGIGTGLAYYNFTDKKWEMHFHNGSTTLTGSHSNFVSSSPEDFTGSMQAVSVIQAYDDQGNMPPDGPFTAPLQRAGRIAGHAGFPFDQKFNATGSQLIGMSNYIQHPFLVEKIVYEFSASWGAQAQGAEGLTAYDAGRPFFSTFALIRQSNKPIYEIITSSFRQNNGSSAGSSTAITKTSTFIATRKREIISFGDVAWTTSNVATSSYFYSGAAGKSYESLKRDVTLIPGFDFPDGATVSDYLTGAFRLEFDARAPSTTKDLGLNFGFPGTSSFLNPHIVRPQNRSSAFSAMYQHNAGGGRSGAATFGTFMGSGRSPSGAVVGTNISGSTIDTIQGQTLIQEIVSGNFKESSPYILF